MMRNARHSSSPTPRDQRITPAAELPFAIPSRPAQRNRAAGMISSRHSRHSCQRVSQSLNNFSKAAAWRSCNLPRPSPPCSRPHLFAQQGVQLETPPLAINHAQQRGMDQPVGRVFRIVFAQFCNLGGQRQPEAFLHADGSGRQQLLFALAAAIRWLCGKARHILQAVASSSRRSLSVPRCKPLAVFSRSRLAPTATAMGSRSTRRRSPAAPRVAA